MTERCQLCLHAKETEPRPALLEFFLQTALGTRFEARLFRDEDAFHLPRAS